MYIQLKLPIHVPLEKLLEHQEYIASVINNSIEEVVKETMLQQVYGECKLVKVYESKNKGIVSLGE